MRMLDDEKHSYATELLQVLLLLLLSNTAATCSPSIDLARMRLQQRRDPLTGCQLVASAAAVQSEGDCSRAISSWQSAPRLLPLSGVCRQSAPAGPSDRPMSDRLRPVSSPQLLAPRRRAPAVAQTNERTSTRCAAGGWCVQSAGWASCPRSACSRAVRLLALLRPPQRAIRRARSSARAGLVIDSASGDTRVTTAAPRQHGSSAGWLAIVHSRLPFESAAAASSRQPIGSRLLSLTPHLPVLQVEHDALDALDDCAASSLARELARSLSRLGSTCGCRLVLACSAQQLISSTAQISCLALALLPESRGISSACRSR
jgi:hypothetical protein